MELKTSGDDIWDPLRKKYVRLTPEEWVRQHMIRYLSEHLGYSLGLMASEHTVRYAGGSKRCDIVAFDNTSKVLLIVECKAPEVTLNDNTLQQIAKYSRVFQPPLLVLTNGIKHYCARIKQDGSIAFLETIPTREEARNFIG
jgi:hypothetical protein